MKTIVLASGNKGKLREFRQMFSNLDYQVEPQSNYDVGDVGDVEETGLTFVENAILKARHAAAVTGLPCIADDSGIEVDALHGAPGIYSARYANKRSGVESNSLANLQQLLTDMEGIPDNQRSCRFQCVLVLMRHAEDPTPIIAQASWEGTLLREPVGENGFGYDPIFWLEDQQCSSAELDSDVKDQLSHRGQALQKLIHAIESTTHPV